MASDDSFGYLPVPPGYARIWSTDGELQLYSLLGEGSIGQTSGGGGWEAVSRPQRRPYTVWKGMDALRIEIPLMLGQAAQKRTLERMCGVPYGSAAKNDEPPPTLKFKANLPHHDFASAPQNEWVIEGNPEWGDAQYTDDGALRYWPVSITLLQYSVSTVERLPGTTPFKSRTMRAGTTLKQFAKTQLGDAKRWKDVQQLNRLDPKCPTNPDYKVKTDRKLRVPARETRR